MFNADLVDPESVELMRLEILYHTVQHTVPYLKVRTRPRILVSLYLDKTEYLPESGYSHFEGCRVHEIATNRVAVRGCRPCKCMDRTTLSRSASTKDSSSTRALFRLVVHASISRIIGKQHFFGEDMVGLGISRAYHLVCW